MSNEVITSPGGTLLLPPAPEPNAAPPAPAPGPPDPPPVEPRTPTEGGGE
ncbi:hypothetical protein [Streptomyces yaizuensis]|uniref:Uncharacterized protein n=1 Tax=Streptomyces yaizuensis TaxID=2989713 RepID=A0ABQ5P502_9ACTN|nr:hypothetical protein [Streptomyces sp. YSPA8]GLF97538.1 hypothetical protein SYYSPA8_24595 [Streptomyces sp. YSPA8]